MESSSTVETGSQEKDNELSGTITETWKKPGLFKNQKKPLKNAFDVDFEESEQILTPEDTDEGTKMSNPFKYKSPQSQSCVTTPSLFSTNQPLSQEKDNELSGTITETWKKPGLFKNQKKPLKNAFDVDFEESEQILTPEDTDEGTKMSNPFKFKSPQSQSSVTTPSLFSKNQPVTQEQENTVIKPRKKPTQFKKQKKTEIDAFNVGLDFSSQKCEQPDIFTDASQKSNETLSQETHHNLRNVSLFKNQKKRYSKDVFNVNFEESKQVFTPEDTDDVTMRKTRECNPFKSSSDNKYNAFDTGFEMSPASTVTSDISSINYVTPFKPSKENLSPEGFDVNFDESRSTNYSNVVETRECNDSISNKSDGIQESLQISFNDLEEQFQVKLNAIIEKATKGEKIDKSVNIVAEKKQEKNAIPEKEAEKTEKAGKQNKENRRNQRLAKPASFVNKRLYDHVIKKIKPKYGIDSVLEAEDVVKTICEVVKTVIRRKKYQKKMIDDLKVEMANRGLIETTNDFYVFVRNFLPDDFREKVIPCLQPGTNIVFPPRDSKNPFEKILTK